MTTSTPSPRPPRPRWGFIIFTVALVLLIAFLIGVRMLAWMLYPHTTPSFRRAEDERIEAMLATLAAGLAAGDPNRACQHVWRAPPGSAACSERMRWFAEHQPHFARSKFWVKKVTSDVHRTQVQAVIEVIHDGASEEETFSFWVSCDRESHTPALNCPLWF